MPLDKTTNGDRTDPFIPAPGRSNTKGESTIILETEKALIELISVAGREKIRWTLREPASADSEEVLKILEACSEILPYFEELLMDRRGFTATGFTTTLESAIEELSLAEMLGIVSTAYALENDFFNYAKLSLRRDRSLAIFLKDENEGKPSGHRKLGLRFYSVEFLEKAEECEFGLTRQLASTFSKELARRAENKSAFRGNLEFCAEVFRKISQTPQFAASFIAQIDLRLELAYLTDKGLLRPNNEDALLVEKSVLEGEGRCYALMAVADGMGGHQAGEVASNLCLELLRCYAPFWVLTIGRAIELDEDRLSLVKNHLGLISDEIAQASEETPELRGMGTTLTGMLAVTERDIEEGTPIQSALAIVFNVGDSRTFLVNGERYAPLTKDHSLVQELVDAGRITEEEAFYHPQKNIISQAIGAGDLVKPDVFSFAIPLDAFVVIASDGLTDLVHPRDLAKIAGESETAEELAHALLDAALGAGGSDNVTIIVAMPRLAANKSLN